MSGKSKSKKMGKRATLKVGDEKLRRVPVYECPDGVREVPVPLHRLRDYDDYSQLPEVATVTHSGYKYEAELVGEELDSAYAFDVENY